MQRLIFPGKMMIGSRRKRPHFQRSSSLNDDDDDDKLMDHHQNSKALSSRYGIVAVVQAATANIVAETTKHDASTICRITEEAVACRFRNGERSNKTVIKR
jgi:hypothetical protein